MGRQVHFVGSSVNPDGTLTERYSDESYREYKKDGSYQTFNSSRQPIDTETGEIIALAENENSSAGSVDSVDQHEVEDQAETKLEVPEKAVNKELVEKFDKANFSGEVVDIHYFNTEICNYARYHNLLNSLIVNKNYSIDKKTSKKKIEFPGIELKLEESLKGLVLPFEQQHALHAVLVLLSGHKLYNDEITRAGTINTATGIILPSIEFRYKTFYKAMGLPDDASPDQRKKAKIALYELSRVEPPPAKLTIETPDGETRSIQVGGKTQNVLFVLDKKLFHDNSDYKLKKGYRIELKPYLFSKVAVEFSKKIFDSQKEDSTIPLPENINEYNYLHPDNGYLHTDCFNLIREFQSENRKYLMALLNYLRYRCNKNARRKCSPMEKLNIQPIKFSSLGKNYLGLDRLIAESRHTELKNRVINYSDQLKDIGIIRSYKEYSENKTISYFLNGDVFNIK